MSENELPHVLRKSLAKKKSNWELRVIGDKENVPFAEHFWLAASGKIAKDFTEKIIIIIIIIKTENLYLRNKS